MGLSLSLLGGLFAVAQLPASAPIPPWADGEGFVTLTRTAEELSIMCQQNRVPEAVKHEGGWRCFQLVGPFEFTLTGILASVLNPLAQAGIGIFALSTFNTDYVLVKELDLKAALAALEKAGHKVNVEGQQINPSTGPRP
jgi:hypothetical protein